MPARDSPQNARRSAHTDSVFDPIFRTVGEGTRSVVREPHELRRPEERSAPDYFMHTQHSEWSAYDGRRLGERHDRVWEEVE